MARIRTIKPEFPQSESMGRCSRDARLLFVNLFTLVDDSGIARGNSRMLASLLFPYDDDAPKLISGWIDELVREDCIKAYSVDGHSYIQIVNWLNHQKIDKPTPSKMPPFEKGREDSRGIAVGREGIKEGIKEGRGKDHAPAKTPAATFSPPDWIDLEMWNLWLKTRKGKKMIPEQMQAQVEKLRKWKDAGLDHARALSDAASAGWQGLFEPAPVGAKSFNGQPREKTRHEKLSEHIAKLTGQDKRELFDDPGVIHGTAERLD